MLGVTAHGRLPLVNAQIADAQAPRFQKKAKPPKALMLARAAVEPAEYCRPNYDVESLIGRVTKNAPDFQAYTQLVAYIRGDNLNRVDWLGRDANLMGIVRGIVTNPIAVLGVPGAATINEMRMRIAALAAKAYCAGNNGYVERTAAQGMYSTLHNYQKLARSHFVGNGAFAFKMLEVRNLVSNMDAAQTRWQRLRHKMFDVLLFSIIVASTFLPILAPTAKATYLPVLGAATAGNIVGIALLRDMFSRKPRPRKWFKRWQPLDERMQRIELGQGTKQEEFQLAKDLRDRILNPPRSAKPHLRTHGYELGCLDLLQRMVIHTHDDDVLKQCVRTADSYLAWGERKWYGGLARQMATGIMLDIADKNSAVANDADLHSTLNRVRNKPFYKAARQLRATHAELRSLGMPQDIDALPPLDEGLLGHRLPR